MMVGRCDLHTSLLLPAINKVLHMKTVLAVPYVVGSHSGHVPHLEILNTRDGRIDFS